MDRFQFCPRGLESAPDPKPLLGRGSGGTGFRHYLALFGYGREHGKDCLLPIVSMNFADFIDLDRQLRVSAGGDFGGIRERVERDRRVDRAGSKGSDEELLAEWSREAEGESGARLGPLMAGAVQWTVFILAIFGLLSGGGAVAALLRYDGTQPINVLLFLGTIVGVQLVMLPLLAVAFLFRGKLRRTGWLVRALVGALLARMVGWMARLADSPERAAKLRVEIGQLRAANSLFSRVQPVLALALVQVFGVAFNVAAAGVLMFLVLFSDLTFSWGTTIRVEPGQIERLTTGLSVPWAEVFPAARPSMELVESTRFVRLDGEFVDEKPENALRAGGWWPFLLAATVTYGLLPRVLALGGAIVLVRREMRRALARSAEVRALKERLRTPSVAFEADSVEASVPDVERPEAGSVGPVEIERGLSVAAVFWAYDEAPSEDVVAGILERRLGANVVRRLAAGGLETPEGAVLEELKEAVAREEIGAVAVFFEPFEPPKADARRFLSRLRERVGPATPIVVFLLEVAGEDLVGGEDQERRAWRRAIGALGDPFTMMGELEVST